MLDVDVHVGKGFVIVFDSVAICKGFKGVMLLLYARVFLIVVGVSFMCEGMTAFVWF